MQFIKYKKNEIVNQLIMYVNISTKNMSYIVASKIKCKDCSGSRCGSCSGNGFTIIHYERKICKNCSGSRWASCYVTGYDPTNPKDELYSLRNICKNCSGSSCSSCNGNGIPVNKWLKSKL